MAVTVKARYRWASLAVLSLVGQTSVLFTVDAFPSLTLSRHINVVKSLNLQGSHNLLEGIHQDLPIFEILPSVESSLLEKPNLLLQAPPGESVEPLCFTNKCSPKSLHILIICIVIIFYIFVI